MLVHPGSVSLCFLRDIHGYKRLVLLRSVGHNKDFPDPHPAPADDVILESCVPDELLTHVRGVFHFVQVITRLCFPEDIRRAVIVVVQEGGLADYRCSGQQVLLRLLHHFFLVRDPCSGTVHRHFLKRSEHCHRPVPEVVSRVQACLRFRRNHPQARFVPVQPQHFPALHSPHEVCFSDAHLVPSDQVPAVPVNLAT